ncbi:hypothetical protein [Nostoc sp. UHCC 0251]|uniref:hypothetical protein n=1 Tax=Nostoc sp. UHCC 0251 TaxID=3110240 RepID=UPI002B20048C|nr:hypothetical protein [Nostoc sp. UHCC 0251]MEA5624259.1 hypothetical protein [Nostoc sp. UHCC 0251]
MSNNFGIAYFLQDDLATSKISALLAPIHPKVLQRHNSKSADCIVNYGYEPADAMQSQNMARALGRN